MFRENLAAGFARFSRRDVASLIKPGVALILSAMLIGLSPAHAQGHKDRSDRDRSGRDRDRTEVWYGIKVEFRGTGVAEVVVEDVNQGKEILRTTLNAGGSARARA